jgi:hypothetical protein
MAKVAVLAHDSGLNRDPLSWDKIGYTRPNCGDDTSGLMA